MFLFVFIPTECKYAKDNRSQVCSIDRKKQTAYQQLGMQDAIRIGRLRFDGEEIFCSGPMMSICAVLPHLHTQPPRHYPPLFSLSRSSTAEYRIESKLRSCSGTSYILTSEPQSGMPNAETMPPASRPRSPMAAYRARKDKGMLEFIECS